MKKAILTIGITFGLFCGNALKAQLQLSLYDMSAVPQSTQMNPALTPDSKWWFGFPAVSDIRLGTYHSGFAWKNLVQNRGSTQVLTLDNALNKLATSNTLDVGLDQELIGFGFKVKKSYFGFSARHTHRVGLQYPKEFVNFIWLGNGNEEFLDERQSFEGLGLNALSYASLGMTYSYDYSDQWSFGGTVNYLRGIAHLETITSDIGITTFSDSYEILVDGRYEIQGAGAGSVIENDSTAEFGSYLGGGNNGVSVDLGASYKLNDEWAFSASVVDLGFINWKNGVNVQSDEVDVLFEGVEITNVFGDSVGQTSLNRLTAVGDTLIDQISPNSSNVSYNRGLRSTIYLQAKYYPYESGYVTAVVAGQFHPAKFKTGMRVGYTQIVNKFLEVNMSYNMFGRSWTSLGTGIAINGGPFQVYFVSDNMLSLFFPDAHRNLHAQVGINFVFERGAGKAKF